MKCVKFWITWEYDEVDCHLDRDKFYVISGKIEVEVSDVGVVCTMFACDEMTSVLLI